MDSRPSGGSVVKEPPYTLRRDPPIERERDHTPIKTDQVNPHEANVVHFADGFRRPVSRQDVEASRVVRAAAADVPPVPAGGLDRAPEGVDRGWGRPPLPAGRLFAAADRRELTAAAAEEARALLKLVKVVPPVPHGPRMTPAGLPPTLRIEPSPGRNRLRLPWGVAEMAVVLQESCLVYVDLIRAPKYHPASSPAVEGTEGEPVGDAGLFDN